MRWRPVQLKNYSRLSMSYPLEGELEEQIQKVSQIIGCLIEEIRANDHVMKQATPHIHLWGVPLYFMNGTQIFSSPYSDIMSIGYTRDMKSCVITKKKILCKNEGSLLISVSTVLANSSRFPISARFNA